jgi:type III secretory pathway component EscU
MVGCRRESLVISSLFPLVFMNAPFRIFFNALWPSLRSISYTAQPVYSQALIWILKEVCFAVITIFNLHPQNISTRTKLEMPSKVRVVHFKEDLPRC